MAKVTRIEPTVPAMKPRLKVAAYARVSMESDRLNHSLSAQISYYSELIQKNPEWEYMGVYADSGISGTSINRRTELQRLLSDCDAGKIDLVLTKSISRMARNVVDLLETVRHLKSIGVDVWFEKENIRSLSADGELMLSILAGYAEEESRSISENAKWSIQKKFERGEQWHRAAYGYRWDGKTFVINEEEAVAIRKIYENFLNDIPMRQTSRWLKERGFACSMHFISYVLNNPVYIGQVILQRYFTENHKLVKNTGQLPRYIIDDNHPAIIDRETFEAVQAKIKASYDFNSAAHRMVMPSPFSAKLICGKCGEHFVKAVTSTNKFDGLQENWICYGKWRKHICNAKNIRGSRLRTVCCDVLGLDEFDENVFSKMVEKIIVNGDLEFHFYDGTVKTATIKYYDKYRPTYSYPHQKPFGYEWNGEGFAVVPHEAEAVRLIFKYYAEGWKIADISRELESQGYHSFRGKLSRRVIAIALDSDFYIGGRNVKAQTPYQLDYAHEPIVELGIFEIVQQRRAIELKKQERRIATRRAQCETSQ